MRRPTTTERTRRLAGSRATWSHWSPLKRSSGSRFFSFLATNAHFSSSCRAVVLGGKGDQLVVELLGVGAGQLAEPGHGVRVDARQSAGLADPAAVGDVGQDGLRLL